MLFQPWIVRAHFYGLKLDQRERGAQRGLVGCCLQAISGEVTAICHKNPDGEGCSHKHKIRAHSILEKRREMASLGKSSL